MTEKKTMRKSTRYLVSIPFLFGLTLLLLFIFIITFFRFLEVMATSQTGISDHLDYFAFIIALLIAIDGLIIMMWEFGVRRTGETRIMRYLRKVDADREENARKLRELERGNTP